MNDVVWGCVRMCSREINHAYRDLCMCVLSIFYSTVHCCSRNVLKRWGEVCLWTLIKSKKNESKERNEGRCLITITTASVSMPLVSTNTKVQQMCLTIHSVFLRLALEHKLKHITLLTGGGVRKTA